MKLRGLLLLLLLLAVLLPMTSAFHYASVPNFGYAGIGSSVVVVAKEDYIYARIQIVVQPLENNTNVLIHGGLAQTVGFTYPNGTTVTVTRPTTFTIILPNSAFFGEAVSWETGQISIGPGNPLGISVLTGQNATAFDMTKLSPPQGVEITQCSVSGDYDLSVQALGVSL